jgi:FkbM family methyltransferase
MGGVAESAHIGHAVGESNVRPGRSPVRLRFPVSLYRLSATALLPYLRSELPGWGRMLRGVGILNDAHWVGAPTKQLRGKLHGYRMTLDLSNWSERQTYFLGRFYDLPTQLLVRAALRAGDSFIDVGANVGMITLLAARCVEQGGIVHSFEPNPVACARLRQHVLANELAHIQLHNAALADEPGELTLTVVGKHTGMGTLAPVFTSGNHSRVTTHRVSVARGDDVLQDLPLRPVMVKIDVEGFECRVLKGLSRLLRERAGETVVVTEAVDAHLNRADASKAELFSIMQDHGYRAFSLRTRRAYFRHRLNLRPIEDPSRSSTNNVVWLSAGGEHERRLRPSITT